ncbi:TIGR03086 family metal-binding protein [Amycolatopsis sp. cmx-4-68]|uniref:TIGR03086 family metal-binding protein n=1 Tax=Amycolatopsis sp. cmx-4-68 TaxID=2790938 RepID=UPI00397C1B0A
MAPAADEAVLAAALDYAVASAAEIGLADLGRRSACAGWTVAEALTHLTQSLRCVAASLSSGVVPAVDVPPAGPGTARTLSRDLGRAAVALGAAARDLRGRRSVAVGGLPLPCHRLVVVGAIEAAVHGWDAARGAGRARPIPGELAGRLLAELPSVLGGDTRRGMFADPVALPPGRPAAERLLAALGRDPSAPSSAA